jgi:hypothetical protein
MYLSSEELYIKNVRNSIRAIKLGTKKPEDTNVGFNLNKLKSANLGMYEELLAEYKKVLEEYKKKNN